MVCSWVDFQPLTPADLILLVTAGIALFGPAYWQQRTIKRKRAAVYLSLSGLLSALRSDLKVIRDERSRDGNEWVTFSRTSMGEISHYSSLLETLIIPHLEVFKLPEDSRVFELFNRYQRNLGVLNQRAASIEGIEPRLKVTTVDELIANIEFVLEGLQQPYRIGVCSYVTSLVDRLKK